MHICTYACVRICLYIYIYIHTHTQTYIYVHTYIYMHTYMYIYIYIYIICIWVCSCERERVCVCAPMSFQSKAPKSVQGRPGEDDERRGRPRYCKPDGLNVSARRWEDKESWDGRDSKVYKGLGKENLVNRRMTAGPPPFLAGGPSRTSMHAAGQIAPLNSGLAVWMRVRPSVPKAYTIIPVSPSTLCSCSRTGSYR